MSHHSPYEQYIDPKLSWVAKIPAHWRVKRNGALFLQRNETKRSDLPILEVSLHTGVRVRNFETSKRKQIMSDLTKYKMAAKNDLAYNMMRMWQGAVGVAPVDGLVSPAYVVARPLANVHPQYYAYLFRTQNYMREIDAFSRGIVKDRNRLYWDQFKQINSLVPPYEEQVQIVNYLNFNCKKIDGIVSEKKKLITLLNEQKKLIIQTAVTKGLNPNVEMHENTLTEKMKFPKHWDVKPLRHLGLCQNGINIGAESFGKGFPFVSYSDVYKNNELPRTVDGLVQSTPNDRKTYSVEEGDVFFTRTSETINEIGYSSVCAQTIKDATFAGFLIRFRPRPNKLNWKFSKYYFRAEMHRGFFIKEMNLVTRASLSQDLLKKLPVLLPPIEEQKKIADYLDIKTGAIDDLIKKADSVISKLLEYKLNLIFEVVTGGRDVRSVVYSQSLNTEDNVFIFNNDDEILGNEL